MRAHIFPLVGALALSVLPLHAQETAAGKQTARHLEREITKTVESDYLLFLPEGYRKDSPKKWPLILFLHGAGERGDNLEAVKTHGPPKIVQSKPDFPFIVVSPQCPAGERWSNDILTALLDEVIEKHAVDTDRVYLTGLSMGGFGSWSLGLAHPERFAAVVPICGGGDPIAVLLPNRDRAQAIRTLPVWAFHGGKDSVVNVENSERMVEALNKIGNNAKLTIYENAGHDSWTETYDNPALYDWLLQQSLEKRDL